jgi:predicted PurR-regulated permease PerM
MMEPFWKSKLFHYAVYVLLLLAILYMFILINPIIVAISRFLSAVLTPFIVAMIVSYVLNPIVNMLNWRKVPRTAAVLLIYAVFITSLTVILMNFIPIFIKQLNELNRHLPEVTMKAQHWLQNLNSNDYLPESVREGIRESLRKFELSISEAISGFINRIDSTLNLIFVAFTVPFLAFYMLKDIQVIEKTALAIVPSSKRKQVVKLFVDIDRALGNYIRGQLIVCVIVGVLAYIGYWLIGLPYPILFASVAAVFNIIPYIGPYFGAAPAILMAATVSMRLVLLVIVVNWVVQTIESNFVSPQIVGKTLHLHPLFIIFALLAGGYIAGIIGLILAVPFVAVMKVILQHVLKYYTSRKTPV